MDITTQKVIEVLADNLGIQTDEITLDDKLVEDLWFDQLDFVEIAFALEDELDIALPDKVMATLDTDPNATIRDLISVVEHAVAVEQGIQ